MKTCIILLLIQTCVAKDGIPVFVLDFDNVINLEISTNPFTKMPTEVFTNILKYAEKKSDRILIIVEDFLSTEDLSLKDNFGTPYMNLQNGLKDGKVVYIPSVVNPYELIKGVIPRENNVVFASADYKFKPFTSRNTYLHFIDLGGTRRSEVLRSHDILMMHAYFNARLMGGTVVGFYTGRVNPIVMEQLPLPKPIVRSPDFDKSMVTTVNVASDGGLFKFSVHSLPHMFRTGFDHIGQLKGELRSRRHMTTTIQYSHLDVQFNFRFSEKDWLLDNVALIQDGLEVGRRQMEVGAPWNWSYTCADPINLVNVNDRSIFVITAYQLQPKYKVSGKTASTTYEHYKIQDKPWLRNDDGGDDGGGVDDGGDDGPSTEEPGADQNDPSDGGSDTFDNSKTVNCGAYFNPAIMAGLFVAALSLLIAGFGVVVLFNCQTNSNFDDVGGKTIVIQAESAQ